MTKHVIDHPKGSDNSRMATEFSRIEGDAKPRPQTLAAQKRSRTAKEGKRLKEYLDIERRSDD